MKFRGFWTFSASCKLIILWTYFHHKLIEVTSSNSVIVQLFVHPCQHNSCKSQIERITVAVVSLQRLQEPITESARSLRYHTNSYRSPVQSHQSWWQLSQQMFQHKPTESNYVVTAIVDVRPNSYRSPLRTQHNRWHAIPTKESITESARSLRYHTNSYRSPLQSHQSWWQLSQQMFQHKPTESNYVVTAIVDVRPNSYRSPLRTQHNRWHAIPTATGVHYRVSIISDMPFKQLQGPITESAQSLTCHSNSYRSPLQSQHNFWRAIQTATGAHYRVSTIADMPSQQLQESITESTQSLTFIPTARGVHYRVSAIADVHPSNYRSPLKSQHNRWHAIPTATGVHYRVSIISDMPFESYRGPLQSQHNRWHAIPTARGVHYRVSAIADVHPSNYRSPLQSQHNRWHAIPTATGVHYRVSTIADVHPNT
jgi:hypothetical protein